MNYHIFGQYRFDTWTTESGLPQNGLRSITQTPDGYLWFSTFGGIVRFDGLKFTTYGKGNSPGIINNRFTGLFSDKDGVLYATTMEDAVLTTYKSGNFFSYGSSELPGQYIIQIKTNENGELMFLAADKENSALENWYYLRDGKFVFAEKQVIDLEKKIFQGKSGSIWTITPTETTELRNGKLTAYPLNLGKLDFEINSFEDSSGNLWLGEHRVHRLGHGNIKTFDEKDGIPGTSIYHSFWENKDGSIWFASGGRSSLGIGLIQYQNEKLNIWGLEHGLSNTSIFDIFQDREGTIWLPTNRGLSRLRKQVIESFTTKDGLRHSEIYPILKDRDENIWIGTTKGLSIYKNGKFQPLNLKPSTKQSSSEMLWRNEGLSVQSLFQDSKGKMWIGLDGGLYLVENGIAEKFPNTDEFHISSIREDKNGFVWATSNQGLLKFKDYKLDTIYKVQDGLPNNFVNVSFEDSKGRFWIGGLGGLSEFKDGKFVNYTIAEGLTGSHVRTIYEDSDGILWIGTYDEGLSRFKDGKFFNYKVKDGLFNNGVFAIEEDNKGIFWISSNHGIYRVNRQELNDLADGKIEKINSVNYGREDGMLSTECNGGRQPASIKTKDGKIWFPTQDGISIVNPENETYNILPPSVVIESATVERKPVEIKNGLTIEPGQRNIEITFTGISLIKSEQIKFKYKLENYDTEWIDAGTVRTAYYSNLPPGNYQFVVIAANSDGLWNNTGASLNLVLKPFFYQTKSFYVFCLMILCLILFMVWKISFYRLKIQRKKLAKLVAEKTIELKKANDELQLLANSDGLTQIGNRRSFEEFLSNEWRRATRFQTPISLVMIDIDHFKNYNDTNGHLAGDQCLQKVAKALSQTINRPTDLVTRFGGEEFAIVLGATDSDGALSVARRVLEQIKSLEIPHQTSPTSNYLTVSIGMATIFPKVEMPEADLITAADKALYQAKENGRNQIHSADFLTQNSIFSTEKLFNSN